MAEANTWSFFFFFNQSDLGGVSIMGALKTSHIILMCFRQDWRPLYKECSSVRKKISIKRSRRVHWTVTSKEICNVGMNLNNGWVYKIIANGGMYKVKLKH